MTLDNPLQKVTCGQCVRFKYCKNSQILRKTKDSTPCRMFDQKKSKMRNQKVTVDGITFDSTKEGSRYSELKLLQRAGVITGFDRQPEFELLQAFEKNGQKYQTITYRADFKVYYPDGHFEIEDVKAAKEFRTEVYRLKRKMFESKYPDMTIKEIY